MGHKHNFHYSELVLLGVMAMKGYSTLDRAPELEPHHQMQMLIHLSLSLSLSLSVSKIKLATVIEGDPKTPFSIATTSRCTGGHNSILWIAVFYS